jgi:hypothetical protein
VQHQRHQTLQCLATLLRLNSICLKPHYILNEAEFLQQAVYSRKPEGYSMPETNYPYLKSMQHANEWRNECTNLHDRVPAQTHRSLLAAGGCGYW